MSTHARGQRLLARAPRSPQSSKTHPLLLTVAEAAETCGLHWRTFYRLIERGHVPGVVRFGRSIRLSRPVFLAWLYGGGVAMHSSSASSGSEQPARMVAAPREDAS